MTGLLVAGGIALFVVLVLIVYAWSSGMISIAYKDEREKGKAFLAAQGAHKRKKSGEILPFKRSDKR